MTPSMHIDSHLKVARLIQAEEEVLAMRNKIAEGEVTSRYAEHCEEESGETEEGSPVKPKAAPTPETSQPTLPNPKQEKGSGDDNDSDIEALVSPAHDLTCQFNVSNLTIDDGHDDESEEDYNSITAYDGDDLPDENTEGGDNGTLTLPKSSRLIAII